MYTSMIFMKQKLEEMTLAFESALADNVALKQDPRASPGIPPPPPPSELMNVTVYFIHVRRNAVLKKVKL